MEDNSSDGSISSDRFDQQVGMHRLRKTRRKKKQPPITDIPIIVVDTGSGSSAASSKQNVCEPKEDKRLLSPKDAEYYRSKRKNSISLPNLDDFQLACPMDLDASDNDIRSNFYISDTELSDQEEYESGVDLNASNGVPLRHARRKSITVMPRMMKSVNGDDVESGSNSPANSITSVNSLASLLREKIQMLPSQIRKKKPKDYKLRVFVTFLFLTVVFLVVFAYVLYQQKVLQRAYFERIKFNKAERLMRIFNQDGVEIIQGRLGTTLDYDQVHPCLPKDDPMDGTICLEWMQRARLLMQRHEVNEDIRCYNLQ